MLAEETPTAASTGRETPKRLILVSMDKGGGGKSFFTILLTQWLQAIKRPFLAFDPDYQNSTLTRFAPESQFLDIRHSENLDRIIEVMQEHPLVLVDGVGSQQRICLDWLEETDLLQSLMPDVTAASYEQFNNHQNQFTYGNGGHFSPQYIIQGIIEAQALTTEGLNWLAQGSIGASGQQNKQDASPYFPLDPDGRDFPGTTSSTGILLCLDWMVGAKLSYVITADYNEGFAAIDVRHFFEPRAGLFRSDLDFCYW